MVDFILTSVVVLDIDIDVGALDVVLVPLVVKTVCRNVVVVETVVTLILWCAFVNNGIDDEGESFNRERSIRCSS